MANEKSLWHHSLRAIDDEYRVASLALRRLDVDARRDPTIMDPDMKLSTITETLRNLNATYAIRLFAEFETSLRTYWVTTKQLPEPSRVAEIIDRIASERQIHHVVLANVHRVRVYRNRQVHDNDEPGETISVEECRTFTGKFLSWLPIDWTGPAH